MFTYDRRGRGESGNTAPYSSAYLYGISSGVALAIEAVARLDGVKNLAVYAAPFIVDDSLPPRPDDYIDRLERLIAENRRTDAVRMFTKTVGMQGRRPHPPVRLQSPQRHRIRQAVAGRPLVDCDGAHAGDGA